jgi:phosphohistidine phosphatase
MQWRSTGGTQLAIVGHEPDLGEWAEQLVWGKAQQRLVVKKAGVIGIRLPTTGDLVGNSELFWLTPPRFLL